MADELNACLNVMRRMPPSRVEQNLSGLVHLKPNIADELLQRVDQPLKLAMDEEVGRLYLRCDYNRDGDSYRSPWSNKYFPALADGFEPPDSLRRMEIQANEMFDAYREMYFEGGVSSVYLWDLEEGFAGCYLLKKEVDSNRGVDTGSWDSIHVLDVHPNADGTTTYKLTSTVTLAMAIGTQKGQPTRPTGPVNLSGSLTRQAESTVKLTEDNPHLVNMGKMIEEMEISMRSSLDTIYIQKTREVINGIRRLNPWLATAHKNVFKAELSDSVSRHGEKRTQDSEV
eukprot:GILJ01001197.1.p1 GENE.GILJ01001197.1~~GILJ01001197.1.p1  ORF type:complete len:285 (-),score=37.57 GILJ01001197.1:107-961(-)